MSRAGGWSPLRSGEVRVEGRRRAVSLYYKFGDEGLFDFCTEHSSVEALASFTVWLDVLASFVRISLLLCLRDTDHAASPFARVREMLSEEWAAASNICTVSLEERGLNLHKLDLILREAWRAFVRLPVPAVFNFVVKDEVARACLVEAIEEKRWC